MQEPQDPQERFALFKTYLENPSLLSKAETLLIHKRLRCKQRAWLSGIPAAQKIISLPIFQEGRIMVQSSWGWERSYEVRDLEIFIKKLATKIGKGELFRNRKAFQAMWAEFQKNRIPQLTVNLKNTFREYSIILKDCNLARSDRLDKLDEKLQSLTQEVLKKLPTHNINNFAIPMWSEVRGNNFIDDLLIIFKNHIPDLTGDHLFIAVADIANALVDTNTTYDAIRGRYYRLR